MDTVSSKTYLQFLVKQDLQIHLVLEHEVLFEVSEIVFELHGMLNMQKRLLIAVLIKSKLLI